MTTINETVEQTLRGAGYGQYMSYAQPVVTALVDREHRIVGELITFARQNGLSEEQARSALSSCGMEVPAVRAVPTAATPMQTADAPGDTEADPVLRMLGDIQTTLAGLTQFARDNGYTG